MKCRWPGDVALAVVEWVGLTITPIRKGEDGMEEGEVEAVQMGTSGAFLIKTPISAPKEPAYQLLLSKEN